MLLPGRLTQVDHVVVGEAIVCRNSSDARHAQDDQGRRWVMKKVDADELLAEALGTIVALELGVPTANGGYHIDKQSNVWWLSELVEPVVQWKAGRAQRLSQFEGLGRILALDALIGNLDRHGGNILLRPTP